MSRETVLAKIAAMAQMLDDAGLYDDAAIMDGLLEAVADRGLIKEAGLWRNILSRLSGWARKALFSEYRTMYGAAKKAQEAINARIEELQSANDELEEMLSQHELSEWRGKATPLITSLGKTEADILSDYDEQRAKMTAQLLKLTPKKEPEKGKPVVSPLLPEDKGEKPPIPPPPMGKGEESSLEEALNESLKPEVIPLTNVKKRPDETPVEPPTVSAPETKPIEPEEKPIEPKIEEPVAPVEPAKPEEAPPVKPVAEPLPGWRKERFGTSGKHGWEWEWEVSPEGDKLRLPKSQLGAASSGKGKILHRQGKKFRPTGGTSSIKLRNLMGNVFWEGEEDPSDPNMVILERTDETVPFPLSMRQEPLEQARKLKDLGKSSAFRRAGIITLAIADMSDEEKLDAAAEAMLREYEDEEMEMDEEEE